MNNNIEKSYRYREAQKRVKKIKGFYVHLLIYLLVNMALLIINTRDEGLLEGMQDLENYSTIFFWGLGLLAHGINVFGSNVFFGKNWEEKKIEKIMEKQKENTWE